MSVPVTGYNGSLVQLKSTTTPQGEVVHHKVEGGTPVGIEVVPVVAGTRLPDIPCTRVVLKNQTGSPLMWGFAASVPLFTLANNWDESVEVKNANMIWIFDADNQGLTFRAYALQ